MFTHELMRSDVYLRLTDTNQWKAVMTVTHERSEDGANWESRQQSVEAYASTKQEAVGATFVTIAAIMEKYEGDLFNADPDSLNPAREMEKPYDKVDGN